MKSNKWQQIYSNWKKRNRREKKWMNVSKFDTDQRGLEKKDNRKKVWVRLARVITLKTDYNSQQVEFLPEQILNCERWELLIEICWKGLIKKKNYRVLITKKMLILKLSSNTTTLAGLKTLLKKVLCYCIVSCEYHFDYCTILKLKVKVMWESI